MLLRTCSGDGVLIAWQEPVFRADNTRSAPVRGNRSDGQTTMIDGMVVRGTEGVKGLDRIEATYGSDEAIDLARGIVLCILNTATDEAMDYGKRALDYFNRILDGNTTGYYREKAAEYRKMLLAPYLGTIETSAIAAPAPKQRIAVTYTNIDTLYVSVFPAAKNLTLHTNSDWRKNNNRDLYKYLDDDYLATRLFTRRFVLDGQEPAQTAATELWLDSLPVGLYDLFFHLTPRVGREPSPDADTPPGKPDVRKFVELTRKAVCIR